MPSIISSNLSFPFQQRSQQTPSSSQPSTSSSQPLTSSSQPNFLSFRKRIFSLQLSLPNALNFLPPTFPLNRKRSQKSPLKPPKEVPKKAKYTQTEAFDGDFTQQCNICLSGEEKVDGMFPSRKKMRVLGTRHV